MADLGERVNKEKLDNYISVLLGLRFMVSGLQDFVVERLKLKQTEIQQNYTPGHCNLNCSKTFGKSFSKWCDTCKHWKFELRFLHRSSTHWNRIKWSEIDSKYFPKSFDEIAKVFVKDVHVVMHEVLKDFSALMSLLRNATLFDVSSQMIDDNLRIRNTYCAHNSSAELHESSKNICFNVFIRFLKIPEIKCTASGKKALNLIEALQLSQGLPEDILQNPEGRLALIEVQYELHNDGIDQTIIYASRKLQKRLLEVTVILNKRKRYSLYFGPSPKSMRLFVIDLVILLCLTYWSFSNSSANESPEGCISMQFEDDWNFDSFVDFSFYVQNLHNQSIISRTWLVSKLHEELVTSKKGVILTAEMGYGKSSIVSNLVCAEQSSDWYDIRKNILAYHFCRYDSIRSTESAYFIRNIVSAIVKRYTELGNAILSDDIATGILYGSRCSEDPISCLEVAVLNPLRNKWKNYQFVVVIDALDECNSGDKNNILQLLFKQIDNFPPNIKFIFTSRNIEQVLSKFNDLNIIQLNMFHVENTIDITQYIEQTSHLTKSQITRLTNVARGNFLHVKLFLQTCKFSTKCDFRNVPNSLEKMYQMNFERVFDNQSSLFEELRPIFEVLCTMTKSMTEEHILEVANISSEKRRKIKLLIGNELGHFLICNDGYLSFLHKSIADFLTCLRRQHLRFFVHKENGHTLFGVHHLNSLNIGNTNIVDVVHHVAMSGNHQLQSMFIQNYAKQIIYDTKLPLFSYLHQAVKYFNSYKTTKFLIEITYKRHINDTDERNMTAAFIAARFGNEHALKCLLDFGADPNFKVIISYSKNTQCVPDLVHTCKQIFFCGYNILHIASQNGHMQTVKMLVERYTNLMFTRNDMNLSAFELAAENGHFEIAKYFLDKSSSFGNFLSMHHAAENGHSDIVELLLLYGIKDTCLPCDGSMYWIPDTNDRLQQDFTTIVVKENSTFDENFSFYDDWYLITCETALNAAVRNGHLKVVELLLSKKTNSLQCSAFDGKNPIMTAVQYNRTVIVNHLLRFKVDLTAKCQNKLTGNYFMYRLSKSEQNVLTHEFCPNGMSTIHLLVVHWNYEMFVLLHSNGLVDLDARDDDQSTPLHYAFCHSNYDFIQIAIILKIDFDVRSSNGSTPYHSAAVCHSLALYMFMSINNKYKLTIPDAKDINGLSILQYGSHIRSIDINLLLEVALVSKHDLYHTDISGKNFLHYAAANGNFYLYLFVIQKVPQVATDLLQQKDAFGNTPVDELFACMPSQIVMKPFKLPTFGDIKEFLSSVAEGNLLEILSPHESFIAFVIDHLEKENILDHFYIKNYILLSILKTRSYPLFYLKVFAEEQYNDAIQSLRKSSLLNLNNLIFLYLETRR